MREQLKLLKKNFVVLGKNTIPILGGSVVLLWLAQSGLAGQNNWLLLLVQEAFIIYFAFSQLQMSEYKYSGHRIMGVLPYQRKSIVLSYYVYILVFFILAFAFYFLLNRFMLGGKLDVALANVLAVFGIIAVMYSVFIPLSLLLGYEKAKYIPAAATICIPYLLVALSKLNIPWQKIQAVYKNMNEVYVALAGIAAVAVIAAVSIRSSVFIYSKKEL